MPALNPGAGKEEMVDAMMAMANAMGECLPQSKDIRELVGHVEQHDPAVHGRNGYRGYRNNREQRLHTDTPTPLVEVDIMILFCVSQAASGGASRICPSARILERLTASTRATLSSPVPSSTHLSLGRLFVLMYPPLPFRRIFLLVFFPFSIFPLRFSS